MWRMSARSAFRLCSFEVRVSTLKLSVPTLATRSTGRWMATNKSVVVNGDGSEYKVASHWKSGASAGSEAKMSCFKSSLSYLGKLNFLPIASAPRPLHLHGFCDILNYLRMIRIKVLRLSVGCADLRTINFPTQSKKQSCCASANASASDSGRTPRMLRAICIEIDRILYPHNDN